MYRLSDKAIEIITSNFHIKRKLAAAMGHGENAVVMDIRKTQGRNIAKNYDGMNKLADLTGIMINDLRTPIEEEESCKS